MVNHEVEKLLDWCLQTQLTWAVLFFACLTGLIELIPSFPRNLLSWNLPLFLGMSLIYFMLIAGQTYSFVRLVNLQIEWENWMRNLGSKYVIDGTCRTRATLMIWIYDHKKFMYSVLLFVAVVWFLIYLAKVMTAFQSSF